MKNTDLMSGRLQALDALRGFDMLMIMGFAGVVTSLCAACGYVLTCWLFLYFLYRKNVFLKV